MNDKPRYTEEAYRHAWRAEIHRGIASGKLTESFSSGAQIKTFTVPSDSADSRPKDEGE